MHSSKMKDRVLSLICLLVLLVVTELTLGYLLEPESYSWSYNYDVKQLEKADEDVDMILIGASRVLRTFEPAIFEEELGISRCLNAGTSMQLLSGSYYHLKYLLTKFDPEYVVLGVTWNSLLRDDSTQAKLIVDDRMGFMSPTKLMYEAQVFSMDEKSYLLDSWRFRDNFKPSAIINNIKSRVYLKNHDYIGYNAGYGSYYAGMGFVYSHQSVMTGNATTDGIQVFNTEEFDLELLSYLDKIVALCQEEGITLYLVSAPMTTAYMYSISNYQDAIDYFEEYAKNNGLLYHNTNYLKDRESFLPDTLMHDSTHVNGEGAKIISRKYAQVLKSVWDGEDTAQYFYKDFDEYATAVERIVSVSAEIETQEDRLIVHVSSLQNEDMIPEYELLLSVDGGEYESISAYSKQTEYELAIPQGDSYTIRVQARQIGNEQAYEAYQEYQY
ncbi:MAG: hypothetical protein IJ485_05800 [Lachnospiraceae bacterium]|nr:hypothetical protein [Lachnospiraceae bacterium]